MLRRVRDGAWVEVVVGGVGWGLGWVELAWVGGLRVGVGLGGRIQVDIDWDIKEMLLKKEIDCLSKVKSQNKRNF